jgi:hypothetical protein
MVHASAVLTPRGRLLLARRVVDEGWPISRAAAHFRVSWPTAKRWASRYAAMGPAGMIDRSSRPHHSPNRAPQPIVRKIVQLRWRRRLSPLAIAPRLSMLASTVHAFLVRCRVNRLSHIDIRTGEPIRRYERDHCGSLIHVGVKRLGNIPDAGVGGSSDAPKARRTDITPKGWYAAVLTAPTWATRSCTPSSTITLGWPTPRFTTMKPPRLRLRCCAAQRVGSAHAASALSVSCLTTAAVTAPASSGVTPALTWKSSTNEHSPTDPDQRQDL